MILYPYRFRYFKRKIYESIYNWYCKDMIVSNPDIMLGKPTVEGTRITVESILGKLAAGRTL